MVAAGQRAVDGLRFVHICAGHLTASDGSGAWRQRRLGYDGYYDVLNGPKWQSLVCELDERVPYAVVQLYEQLEAGPWGAERVFYSPTANTLQDLVRMAYREVAEEMTFPLDTLQRAGRYDAIAPIVRADVFQGRYLRLDYGDDAQMLIPAFPLG